MKLNKLELLGHKARENEAQFKFSFHLYSSILLKTVDLIKNISLTTHSRKKYTYACVKQCLKEVLNQIMTAYCFYPTSHALLVSASACNTRDYQGYISCPPYLSRANLSLRRYLYCKDFLFIAYTASSTVMLMTEPQGTATKEKTHGYCHTNGL